MSCCDSYQLSRRRRAARNTLTVLRDTSVKVLGLFDVGMGCLQSTARHVLLLVECYIGPVESERVPFSDVFTIIRCWPSVPPENISAAYKLYDRNTLSVKTIAWTEPSKTRIISRPGPAWTSRRCMEEDYLDDICSGDPTLALKLKPSGNLSRWVLRSAPAPGVPCSSWKLSCSHTRSVRVLYCPCL